jgi:hypothetical protein
LVLKPKDTPGACHRLNGQTVNPQFTETLLQYFVSAVLMETSDDWIKDKRYVTFNAQ